MSNNTPDYHDNLAFPPQEDAMPLCDIKKLQSENNKLKIQLKTANDTADNWYAISNDKGIENKMLRDVLRQCRQLLAFEHSYLSKGQRVDDINKMIGTINNVLGEKDEIRN